MPKPYQYWELRSQEVVLSLLGLLLGAAFGFGIFRVQPAPPWWFLPLPGRSNGQPLVELDTWSLYADQGGYEFFWLQSTWGWAIVGAIAGLVFSNVVLRKKEL